MRFRIRKLGWRGEYQNADASPEATWWKHKQETPSEPTANRESWRKSDLLAFPSACPSLGTESPRIAKIEGSGQALMHSREQLTNGFRRLGVGACDMVMLHASVRAVGEIAGGPDQIHLALKDVITREGTLMMYASCPRYYDEVRRCFLCGPRETHTPKKRTFSPASAEPRDSHCPVIDLPGIRVSEAVQLPPLQQFQPQRVRRQCSFGAGLHSSASSDAVQEEVQQVSQLRPKDPRHRLSSLG